MSEPLSPSRRHTSTALASLLLVLMCLGCGVGRHDEGMRRNTAQRDRIRVCGVSLTEDSAHSLHDLLDHRPVELRGSIPLSAVTKQLRREKEGLVDACRVYGRNQTNYATIDVQAERDSYYPTRADYDRDVSRDWRVYRIGKRAWTSWAHSTSANLYFSCANRFKPPSPHLIHTILLIPVTSRDEDQRIERAAMSLLNSVSRRIAHELRCEVGTELPRVAPASTSLWEPAVHD